jgi:diamine N-acetyltransferase
MKFIRAARLSELGIVHDLAHSIWPSAYGAILSKPQLNYMLDKIYSLASLQAQFSMQHHSFIFLIDDTTPIGFASFSEKENDSSVYHLHKIYVLPQQQGKGSGKMLLDYVVNIAKLNSAVSLTLNVNRYNKARSFYEKYGFIIKGEADIDIGKGYFMNDYIMELPL